MEKELINISQPLQEIFDQLIDLLGEKKAECKISPECMVEGNRILVEIMLTNLLMNAWRHTNADAKIVISLSPAELVVSNTGSLALNPEKLFRRFSTASVQTPGTGLGLSIVKEICNRYGWTVGYNFTDLMHVFTVSFKNQLI